MNQWSEENFLERLMPELRRESRVRAESCPDADLLAAFAEDRVSGFVRESVTTHLAQCRHCSEVCARLVNFDAGAFAAQDAEWPNAEKRLQNWMDGFLAAKRAAGPARTASAREVPRSGFGWRMPWALGTAVAVGVIVGGALVGGTFVARRGWRNPTVQVAQAPVVQTPNPVVTPAPMPSAPSDGPEIAKTPAATPTGTELAQNATPSAANHGAGSANAGSTKTGSPKAGPPTTSGAETERHSAAAPSPQRPSPGATARFAAHTAGRPAASATSATPTPTAPNAVPATAPSAPATTPAPLQTSDNSDQIAQQFSPPNLNPNDRIQAGSPGQSSAPPATSTTTHGVKGVGVSLRTDSPHTASAAGRTNTNTTASRTPTAPPPAQLRLEANKRLWIRASLLNQNPDGSFTFSGSLLQPVDQGGVHLDSDTRLEGAGLVKDGAVTISVNSLKYRGVFYFLHTSGDQPGDQKPGAGKALQFHNGQIIEMWFLAPSVYEKAPGDQAKP